MPVRKPFIGISCNLPVTDFADQCDYFHFTGEHTKVSKLGLRSRSVCFLERHATLPPPAQKYCFPFPVWKGRSRGLPLERIKSLRQQLRVRNQFLTRGAEQWLQSPPIRGRSGGLRCWLGGTGPSVPFSP